MLAISTRKKQLSFLNGTIKHYSKNPRAIGSFNGVQRCLYSPTTESQGCAIGRHIKDKELCYRLDLLPGAEAGVANYSVFKLLPEELKQLKQGFLESVQKLHDTGDSWDEQGLSEIGRRKLSNIKETWGLYNLYSKKKEV